MNTSTTEQPLSACVCPFSDNNPSAWLDPHSPDRGLGPGGD